MGGQTPRQAGGQKGQHVSRVQAPSLYGWGAPLTGQGLQKKSLGFASKPVAPGNNAPDPRVPQHAGAIRRLPRPELAFQIAKPHRETPEKCANVLVIQKQVNRQQMLSARASSQLPSPRRAGLTLCELPPSVSPSSCKGNATSASHCLGENLPENLLV